MIVALGGVDGLLPLPLGGGAVAAVAPTDVDVMVDTVPLWLAIDGNNPYVRQTADYQKQQVDQANEAGEQSLAGWWTRSQMSFHGGAGQDYLDTTGQLGPLDRVRYKTSYNADVWTPGFVKQLNGTSLAHTVGPGERVWIERTTTGVIVARPSKVELFDGKAWTTVNYGSVNPVRAFCSDGVNYYVATIDGVYRGPLTGATAGVKWCNLPGTDLPMSLGWVKQRIMFGFGPAVHVLDGVNAPTLPAALMTHPTPSWRWSTWCDGPSGILGSGYAGLNSGVYKFGEDTPVGQQPQLEPGTSIVTMPGGEIIYDSLFYEGSFLILATSRGVRACAFQSYYGTVSMGPLSVYLQGPITGLGSYDRYVYAGGQGTLFRVDMGTPTDQAGHFAWAPDLPCPSGPVTAVSFTDEGLKYVGVQGFGVLVEQSAPDPAATGWVQTSRMRFSTVEDKYWAYASVRGVLSDAAPIGVEAQTPSSDWASVFTATLPIRYELDLAKGEWLALRLTVSGGAQLSSYQVQALPGGARQRLLSFPVRIYNQERTRSGLEVGYPGFGRERLATLERLEQIGEPITLTAPALFPEKVRCIIEKLAYQQVDDPGDRGDGTGGVAVLTVRTVA